MKSNVIYPDVPSTIKPVSHSEAFPIPVPRNSCIVLTVTAMTIHINPEVQHTKLPSI